MRDGASIVCVDPRENLRIEVDEIHFVDRHDDMADAHQRDNEGGGRVCGRTPLRASIKITAASAVDAPVAMLRVY